MLFYIDIPAILHPLILILQPVLHILSCSLDYVLRLPAPLLYVPDVIHALKYRQINPLFSLNLCFEYPLPLLPILGFQDLQL